MTGVMLLKAVHVGCVALTFVSFTTRAVWMLNESPRLATRAARVLPHVIDTVLLLSAVALMFAIHQYPVADSWLSAKVIGLMLYIALGTVALKRGKTRPTRVAALAGAYLGFVYIVAVAITHDPLPVSF